MLAARAHGVGSSIGWFVGGGVPAVKELLGVPQERRVRSAVSLGYPREDGSRGRGPVRKPISEIVHEERYGR